MMYLAKSTALPAVALSALLIVGCDAGQTNFSATSANSSHQAIDGYLVNSNVFCDGVRNGQTGAAGTFDCPQNTTLLTVRGGTDVGFGETLLSGGAPFIGELQGPGTTRYITPLTTIAVKMATNNGDFNQQLYQQAATSIITSLGIPNLDLAMNPVENFELAKANAQVHQLVAQFSTTEDDYAVVIDELATIFKSGLPVDLSNDTSTIVSLLNERLASSSPNLALPPSTEASIAAELAGTNAKIEQATSTGDLDTTVTQATNSPVAFSIDSSAPLVRYDSYRSAPKVFSLSDIQDPTLHFGVHTAEFPEDWDEVVHISTGAFSIDNSLDKATINVGIEFTSTTDNERLSVTLSGARLSMKAGDSNSVKIEVPEGTIINARGVDNFGIVTDVSTFANQDEFATSEDGAFSFGIYVVNKRLRDNGHSPLLDTLGNYQMTVVISGVRFNVQTADGQTQAEEFTVSNASESITGHGLRGYVSRTR